MARFRSLLFLLLVVALVLLLQTAPTATAKIIPLNQLLLYKSICEGSNYTANSSFRSNLRTLLASLSASNPFFHTAVEGTDSNMVYGLVMCRGDVDSNKCKDCIKTASSNITQLCPQSKQAIVWYEHCQLRYSDVRFFSSIDGSLDKVLMLNPNKSTDPETFTPAAKELMGKVADFAARNSSSLLFATGTMKYRIDMPLLYGLAQCTGDLSADVCSQCLHEILDIYWNNSDYAASRGGRIVGYSCNFRYEVDHFFDGDPTISLNTTISPSPLPSPAPTLSPPPAGSNISHPPTPTVKTESQSGKGSNIGKVLTIAITSAVGLALVITLCICLLRRRSSKDIVLGSGMILHQSRTFPLLLDLLGPTKHIKKKNRAKNWEEHHFLQLSANQTSS